MDISTEQTYYGKKELKYLFKKQEGSSDLVVVFSAFPMKGGKPLYNYVKTIAPIKTNQLFILDQYGADPVGSYYIGENGDKSIEESVIDLIDLICVSNNIKRENIVSAGSSKGGFAAIYFALKYGFKAAISGGPQIYLGNYLFKETSVGPPTANYIAGGNDETHKLYLNEIIQSALNNASITNTELMIHVGNGDPVYKNHLIPFVEELKIKNINYHLDVANYQEHNDLIKFFPAFLLGNIRKFVSEVLNDGQPTNVIPYPIERITTQGGVDVFLRDIFYYDHKGLYLNNEKMNVEKWNVSFEESSVPKNFLRSGETSYNPITISHYGLQHYNLYLLTNESSNKDKFLGVCNFLTDYIDDNGGFPFNFDHYFYKGKVDMLESGWYSAMGQGMAISNLTRAYNLTGELKYIETARKALKPFTVSSKYGGVLTHFDNSPFYEEYPTNPSSYVLNGFIYSLLGLYDLYATEDNKLAKILFEDGVKTLKRTIGLFDLGDRTAYDLSHYSVVGYPPNIARWQYHVTHIHLVKAIFAITEDPVYSSFIERWIGYLHGKKISGN